MIVILGSLISSPNIISVIIAAEYHHGLSAIVDSQYVFQSNLKVPVFPLVFSEPYAVCSVLSYTIML